MKHAAYGLVAAFLATGVYGAIPTTAEGWYEPEGGFTAQSGTGTIYYGYDRATGQWQTTTVTVDEQGNIKGGDIDFGRDYDLMTAYQALTKALYNEAYNAVQDEAIQTIGKNLHALTSKDGIHIRNENTGQEFTIKFGGSIASAVSGSTGDISATSDAEDPTDKKSIDWTDNGKLELKGWAEQDASGSFWDSSPGPVGVPVRTGYGGAAMAYRNWYGVDGLSLAPESSTHKLELNGWYDAPATMTPLAEAIAKEHKGTFDSYDLVVRNSSKGLNYVSLGTLDIGGAPVDGSSITTNSTDGASESGVASLRGWSDAEADDFPRKGSDGHLEWKSPDDLVDGSSIAWAEVDGGKKFEVKDAHVYAGQHSRHYFGTSNDKTASLGWHELPNVTTNRVEGDNITIASTVDAQDPGLKLLGLKGWNKGWGGDPLFVVNAGGSVGYIPLPALTNLAACACTQKWENVTEWIGGGAEVDDGGGLTLPNDSLDGYLYDTLGYVYSTTPDNLHFDNDGEGVEASFGAPVNWADGESVEAVDGTYQVKGWADASACAASVSTMLSSPGGSDATTHLFLAKKTDTGALHYVSIGNGVKADAEVDDTTITTNTAHGAVTSGEASIYGWSSAANDTYLSKNASGNLEWRQVAGGGAPVDDVSITTNTTHGAVTSGVAGLFGFADAPLGTVPIAVSDGGTKKLGWGTTGNFGITATKNGANWIYTVDGGYFTRARAQTYVSGITVSTSGYVYLKVPLGTGSSATIVLESATKTSDSSYTYILLYYCNVSMGVADYRGAPHIQVWE